MKAPSRKGASNCVSGIINAPRNAVYQAFVDKHMLVRWMHPDNTSAHVHVFEPYEGGKFRISLTYNNSEHDLASKSSGDMDTYHGRFSELIPFEKITEEIEFETQEEAFKGEMLMIVKFVDDPAGGTLVTLCCENLPKAIRPEDNEAGSKESLRKLAALFA
ncbi:MAG: hypothetical protein JWR54_579 [Mucilaginibacter sp.]|nr:hypothetical protein [Mucilaginibacter sp.]